MAEVPEQGSGRRGPDLLTLVAGLVCLAAAAMVLTGWASSLRWLDLRWVLTVAAIGLGALLLVGSLRRD